MKNSSYVNAKLVMRAIFFAAFTGLLIGCGGGGGQKEGTQLTVRIQSIPESLYNSTILINLNVLSYGTAKANLNIDFRESEQDSWHKTTALPGRPNPITAPTINLPNGNLRIDFWWHAIADLGQGKKHEGVYIRASVSTELGAYTIDTIGPLVFNYQENPDTGLPPYVPGGDLPTAVCGEYYETQLGITGGDTPVVWTLIPPGTQLPPFLEMTWNGIVRGTIPEYYGPASVKFNALATDSNEIVERETAGAFNIEIKCDILNEPPPSIAFDSLPKAQVGEFYSYQATATAGFGDLKWSVTAGNPPGWLAMTKDGLLYGTPGAGSIGQYLITIKVCDSHPDGSRCDSREFTFQVLPEEIDCGDPPSIATSSLEPIYEKAAMEPVQLTVSGGYGTLTWEKSAGNLPPGITLNNQGVLQGNPESGTAGNTFHFTVKVTDSCPAGARSAEKELALTVMSGEIPCGPGPVILTESITDADIGEAYDFTFESKWGEGSVTWILEDPPQLPDGLAWSGNGKISGTPSPDSAGSYKLTVTARDECIVPQSDTKIFDFTINPCSPGPVILTDKVDDAIIGEAYEFEFEYQWGHENVSWILENPPALPDGLSWDNGTIYGTPSTGTEGLYQLIVTARDECVEPQEDTGNFDFRIQLPCAGGLQITTSDLPAGKEGEAYQATLAVLGGEPEYVWHLFGSSSLPSGLEFEPYGYIHGTPNIGTAGTINITVEVQDSCWNGSQLVQKDFDIFIASGCFEDPPEITTGLIDDAIEGEPYEFQLDASGGTQSLLWEIIPDGDSLPSNVQLLPNGMIYGTLDIGTAGSYDVHFGVCDSCPEPRCDEIWLTFPVIIACNEDPVFTSNAMPKAYVGSPYYYEFGIDGGEPPFYWFLGNPEILPDSFQFDQDGQISGDPVADDIGTYPLSVWMCDSCWFGTRCIAQDFDLVVENSSGCAPSPIIEDFFLEQAEGLFVYFPIAVSGGEGNLTWELVSSDPPLPSGLELSPDGIIIGTTGVGDTGMYDMTIKVCDECADPSPQCDQQSFLLSLTEAGGCTNSPPEILDITIPAPTADFTPYSYFMNATGGDSPLFFIAYGFPPGIDIDQNTGEISGSVAPQDAGDYEFYIAVYDSCSPIPQADSAVYQWTVE